MPARTTETTVTFGRPFALTAFDAPQPAGTYRPVVDEEEILGPSYRAFRLTATMLHVPAIAMSGRGDRAFLVDAAELAAAPAANGRTCPGPLAAPPGR